MIKIVKLLLPVLVAAYLHAMSVRTAVQPETGRIGDQFLFTVSVELGDELHLTFPRITDRMGPFMVLSQNTESSFTDSLYKRDFHFHLSVFDTGFQVIPSFPLKIMDPEKDKELTVYTDSIIVYIESVLKEAVTIPDVYDPLPVPVLNKWQKVLLGFLILCTGLATYGFIIIKRKKRITEEITVPEISPIEILKENLNKLRNKSYHLKGEWKAFYLELTAYLKEYLEQKYFIHISDLPVSELISALRAELGQKWTDGMSQMLQFADLVKFARTQASTEKCEKDMIDVLNWCLETEKPEISDNLNRVDEKSP